MVVSVAYPLAFAGKDACDDLQTWLLAVGELDLAEVSAGRESALYARAVADLRDKGWPVQTLDCTVEGPDRVAARMVSLIYRALGEKSLVCP